MGLERDEAGASSPGEKDLVGPLIKDGFGAIELVVRRDPDLVGLLIKDGFGAHRRRWSSPPVGPW